MICNLYDRMPPWAERLERKLDLMNAQLTRLSGVMTALASGVASIRTDFTNLNDQLQAAKSGDSEADVGALADQAQGILDQLTSLHGTAQGGATVVQEVQAAAPADDTAAAAPAVAQQDGEALKPADDAGTTAAVAGEDTGTAGILPDPDGEIATGTVDEKPTAS